MRSTLALLVLVAACGRPTVVPPPQQPLTVQTLVGGCYRLRNGDGTAVDGLFWSGLVRLDSARSLRLGRARMVDPPWMRYSVTTLAAASEPLTRDTPDRARTGGSKPASCAFRAPPGLRARPSV